MKFTNLKVQVLLAAIVLIQTVSCSNEEYIKPAFENRQEGFITFSIPGLRKKPVTYSVKGSDTENKIDSLDIYMFHDGTKQLEKIFRVGNTDFGQSDANLTATINVTGHTGKRIFYFVANGKGNTSVLADASEGSTLEDDFRQQLTDSKSGFIQTPLLMTARKEIDNIETANTTNIEVRLTRRVARFDAENDSSETNFRVDEIIVDKAKQQGYIFGDATATSGTTISTGQLPVINYGDSTGANTGTPIHSLFYLYPTEIGADNTMIYIIGVFNGEQRIYSLKNNFPIEANKRYTLKVKRADANEPEFNVLADNWEDSDTHEAEATNEVVFSAITMTGGAGVTENDGTYDITHIGGETTLSFTAESYNASATKAIVTGNVGDLPGFTINTPTPVLSYGVCYVQHYEIVIPKRINKSGVIDIQVAIVNQSNTKQRLSIAIHGDADEDSDLYYPGTTLMPVAFGDVLWAPVNVGATEIDETGTSTAVKHLGHIFQWGRNTAFVPGKTNEYYTGPVSSPEIALTGEAMGKFIITTAAPNDWLSQKDDNLWTGENQQGPCPDGWRLPTKAEFLTLKAAFDEMDGSVVWNDERRACIVKGNNGTDELYLPSPGRLKHDGTFDFQGTLGSCWSSDVNGAEIDVLSFNNKGYFTIDRTKRGVAVSVRCVQKL